MFEQHYAPLVIAYLVGLTGWLGANRLWPDVWPRRPIVQFENPWAEFGIALAGAVGVIAVGQLWSNNLLLPEKGALRPVLGSINQVLIFAPIMLAPVIRRQPWTTAWFPSRRIPTRILLGFVLASLAVTAYGLLRNGADAPWVMVSRIWRYQNIDEMVQVFLEDLAIAILFVRLAGAIGSHRATVVVACLFAAGHIPALLSEGATWIEFVELLRDAGLGVAVILVLQRSRDILWFWCVHFCLDMTQFARISGAE